MLSFITPGQVKPHHQTTSEFNTPGHSGNAPASRGTRIGRPYQGGGPGTVRDLEEPEDRALSERGQTQKHRCRCAPRDMGPRVASSPETGQTRCRGRGRGLACKRTVSAVPGEHVLRRTAKLVTQQCEWP